MRKADARLQHYPVHIFSPTGTCTPSYLYLPPSPLAHPKPPPTAFIPVVGLPSLPRASPSPLGLSAISRLRLKCVWASDLQLLPCPFASITAPASQANHRSAFY